MALEADAEVVSKASYGPCDEFKVQFHKLLVRVGHQRKVRITRELNDALR